jgi:hypothetical protein
MEDSDVNERTVWSIFIYTRNGNRLATNHFLADVDMNFYFEFT